MGGAAGIWKKIKKIGSEVGSGLAKAFAWANTNLVQPLKPILSNVINMFDSSGLGSKVFETVTDGYDNYLDFAGEKPTDGFGRTIVDTGKNLFEYTQDTGRFKKAFDPSQELNVW